MKGLIALDIDGTLTPHLDKVSPAVVAYLEELQQTGWVIFFITGRPFQFSEKILSFFSFPYFLAVQNGAILLKMPQQEILQKKYVSKAFLPLVESICFSMQTDFVVYGGVEINDLCFYRPDRFHPKLVEYLRSRCEAFGENWEEVQTFDHLPLEAYPSLKCFGLQSQMLQLADRLESELQLHVPVIKDPFAKEIYVAQATFQGVDKGQALLDLCQQLSLQGPTIAAGDDLNDLPMLHAAGYKIVMDTAPPSLKKLADVVAPPAVEDGLIKGLKEIISQI